jgi:hypothetical protein
MFMAAVPAVAQIHNVRKFLDQCPQNDPAYAQIRADFEIRRNGQPTTIPPCTEPVSAMATAAYTDELLIVQGLRVAFYMDRGQAGHLPWTAGTLYAWMKSKIGGVDIVAGGSFCCEQFGGKTFIAVGAQDDFNREFDKKWIGIAGNIDLYAHETRHVDGFPHSSCCGITNGCDNTFDTANLSPYGIQWWLNMLWLEGTINVGTSCLPPLEKAEAVNWFLGAVNSQFGPRFCSGKPNAIGIPVTTLGPCLDKTRHRAVGRF